MRQKTKKIEIQIRTVGQSTRVALLPTELSRIQQIIAVI